LEGREHGASAALSEVSEEEADRAIALALEAEKCRMPPRGGWGDTLTRTGLLLAVYLDSVLNIYQ
jgi:hypothetical protein